jgi:hypothetical protein
MEDKCEADRGRHLRFMRVSTSNADRNECTS